MTSQEERQAAVLSGSIGSAPPVFYSLPPEFAAEYRTGAGRPGMSLLGADLRPDLMVNNVRAAAFPHLQLKVQHTMATGIVNQAMAEVESLEELHKWKCGNIKPKIKAVEAVEGAGEAGWRRKQEQQALPAQTGTQQQASNKTSPILPPPTRLENFLARLWGGHLWDGPSTNAELTYAETAYARMNPEDRADAEAEAASQQRSPQASNVQNTAAASSSPVAPAAAAASASASASDSASSPSTYISPSATYYTTTGTMHVSSVTSRIRLLSSERWLVERCDGECIYRVNYISTGDAFHAQVIPTNISGALASLYINLKQWIRV